jgi:glycosyltransferase involved in cell wall biosynthesis
MTVLQVVPSLEAGGAERATIDVSRTLVEAGHRAIVVSAGGHMLKELESTGALHITQAVDSKNPVVIWKNAAFLTDLIRREKIDVIHARSRAPAWSAWMAARRARIPFVTTFHAAYKGRSFLKKIYNGIMAKGARIIAVSHFIANHIHAEYGVPKERIRPIPRGIDLGAFNFTHVQEERKARLREAFALQKHVPLIIMPGRLSPIKGQELALRALAKVTEWPFRCLFIGPDQGRVAYREELEKLIVELGLQEKAQLIGQTDLVAAYAMADLVLSPSQVAEGFGRVPVEAQAFGVPVIATALGATSETVLEGKTGWLVPVGDVDALAAAIRHALTLTREDRQQIARTAIRHVQQHFDMHKMCADTLAVYQEVLT